MSKSIYEEALEIIDKNTFELGKGLDVLKPTYREAIVHALKKALTQEKLLECYKTLITIKDDMLSCCAIVDDDYYDIDKTATHFESQIKVLEELLK